MDFAGLRVKKLALPITHQLKKNSRLKKSLNLKFPSHNLFFHLLNTSSSFIKPVVNLLFDVVMEINVAAMNIQYVNSSEIKQRNCCALLKR